MGEVASGEAASIHPRTPAREHYRKLNLEDDPGIEQLLRDLDCGFFEY
jgi:hypothetical protein